MASSTTPPPPTAQFSRSIVGYGLRGHGGDGADATSSSGTSSDLAQHFASQTSHITLPAQRGATQVYCSPNSTGLASQTVLPDETVSTDLRGGARPVTTKIDSKDAVPDQETCCRHIAFQPPLGDATEPSVEPIQLHTLSANGVALSPATSGETTIIGADGCHPLRPTSEAPPAATGLTDLPNEVLLHILIHLDVSDLLCTSRTSHRLRDLSVAPILHSYRLRQARTMLPPMLWSPNRPSLADLMRRSIFLTRTTVVSRKLARSLVCIRLARRLAARPSVEALVARSVLPPECLPTNKTAVAPALVAKKRAVERERVKDGLRRWVERVWRGEVRERSEGVKRWEEKVGVGRVWRLRRFWEGVGGNIPPSRRLAGNHASMPGAS